MQWHHTFFLSDEVIRLANNPKKMEAFIQNALGYLSFVNHNFGS